MTKVYNIALRIDLSASEYVPDHLMTQEMCNEAVRIKPCLIMFLIILRHKRCTSRLLKKNFLTIWYAEIKNVLIKEDVEIWSKRGYD